MISRLYFFVFTFFFAVCVFSQNKKIIFGFNEIPQSLMVNPGTAVTFDWHSGVPALSGVYLHAGISGFSAFDLFADDGININSKIASLLTTLNNTDFYTVNQQVELLNFGFKLRNNKDYLSFGFYEEFDGFAYHPKDLVSLAYHGNQDFNKKFDLRDLSFKAELLGVYHIGLSHKVNDKLTIGGRFKIYSSVFNVSSTNNFGLLFTVNGENNIYRHRLQDVDISVNSSGIIHNKKNVLSQKKLFSNLFFSSNIGAGIDFGLTYNFNNHWSSAASLLDFGFIRHSKNTSVYSASDSQNVDGIHLLFPEDDPINYLQDLNDEINYATTSDSFTTFRSLKFNGSVAYNFGLVASNSCLRPVYNGVYGNEVGLQIFSVFRPKRPQFAASLFYYKRLSSFLRAKITYSVDAYSTSNFGVGFSSHFGLVNFYGSVDNVIGLSDLSKSNNQSFNFGLNLILDSNFYKP